MCLGGGWEVGALGAGVENWQNCSPSLWPPAGRSSNPLLSESAPPPSSEAFHAPKLPCCHPTHVVRTQNGSKRKSVLAEWHIFPGLCTAYVEVTKVNLFNFALRGKQGLDGKTSSQEDQMI